MFQLIFVYVLVVLFISKQSGYDLWNIGFCIVGNPYMTSRETGNHLYPNSYWQESSIDNLFSKLKLNVVGIDKGILGIPEEGKYVPMIDQFSICSYGFSKVNFPNQCIIASPSKFLDLKTDYGKADTTTAHYSAGLIISK